VALQEGADRPSERAPRREFAEPLGRVTRAASKEGETCSNGSMPKLNLQRTLGRVIGQVAQRDGCPEKLAET
jgi:hypothetical protein